MHENPYAAPLSSRETSPAETKSRKAAFHWPFILAVVIWTMIAIALANQDRSWGALYIAIVGGPAVNAAILLVALVYGASRKFWNRQLLVGIPILLVLMTAIISSMVIFGSIMSMDLHGC